ncbi:MAG: hypothetical protein KatS3mg108_1723 [Isosphaeraceae bacterium]|jgi:hypothetical protein|nr:MAG: hypothetical protein KatS3mg108_1723 [Isosphaeraceae bacterium]
MVLPACNPAHAVDTVMVLTPPLLLDGHGTAFLAPHKLVTGALCCRKSG